MNFESLKLSMFAFSVKLDKSSFESSSSSATKAQDYDININYGGQL